MYQSIGESPAFKGRKLGALSGLGQTGNTPKTIWGVAWSGVALTGMAASAYHGYKRNNSVGWAIWWALMGGMFPIITVPIALAQGFAKPAQK